VQRSNIVEAALPLQSPAIRPLEATIVDVSWATAECYLYARYTFLPRHDPYDTLLCILGVHLYSRVGNHALNFTEASPPSPQILLPLLCVSKASSRYRPYSRAYITRLKWRHVFRSLRFYAP
jgi:hypothetical protein